MDDYESIIVGDKTNEVKQSVSSVIDKNPDVEARFQNLAKTYGIPVTAIRLDPETTERRAKLDSYDYESIVKTLPSTASLMADPTKAAIAHDDVDNMSIIEKTMHAAKIGWNSTKRGWYGLKSMPPSIGMASQANTLMQLDMVDQALAEGAKIEADPMTGNPILTYESSGNTYAGAVKSFDSDGFTITWTKSGSPTGTLNLYALCLR